MVSQEDIILPEFRRGFHLISSYIEKRLPPLPETGLVNIFIHHTSAALAINENADPSVKHDIISMLGKIIPQGASYSHSEGNSDSHIKSSIFGSCLNIFIENGRLCLGAWQGIFFAESDGPRSRQVWVKILEG